VPEVGEGPVFAKRKHDRRRMAALLAGLALSSCCCAEVGARLPAIGGAQRKLERMVLAATSPTRAARGIGMGVLARRLGGGSSSTRCSGGRQRSSPGD
jgi:hypothetical protein